MYVCMVCIKNYTKRNSIEQINMYNTVFRQHINKRVIHRPESYYNVSTKILISIM